MSITITGAGIRFVEKHGIDRAVEVIGRNKMVVQRWVSGANEPSVDDLQRLANFDPSVIEVRSPSAPENAGSGEEAIKLDPEDAPVPPSYQWPEGKFLAILMPSNQAPELPVTKSLLRLFERDKMEFLEESSTLLIYSRNRLAARFLAGPWPWAFMLDGDIALPCGDVDWFRSVTGNPKFPAKFANINPIARLMSANQKIIGGCYYSRRAGGKAQFNEAHVNQFIDRMAHSGPRAEIEKTRWVANGCMLVHRDVFLDIIKTQGDQIRVRNPEVARQLGYEYRFFTPPYDDQELADNSEDVSFCIRATKAGHQVYVDHAVVPAHIGKTAYSYHNTGINSTYFR